MKTRPNLTQAIHTTDAAGPSPPSRSSGGVRAATAPSTAVRAELWKRDKEAEKILEGLANR